MLKMVNYSQQNSVRERIGHVLGTSKKAAVGEMMLVLLVMILVYYIGNLVKNVSLALSTVVTAWLFISVLLWLQHSGWKKLGLRRPQSWLRTVLIALGGVVTIHFLIGVILMPIVVDLTKQSLDIRHFDALRGNLPALLMGLLVVWILAAFGEEMVFRGYFLNRLAGLFPNRNYGWAVGIMVSSVIFGAGHLYQGLSGVILSGIVGIIYCFIYLADRQNLWALILTHGLYDTSAFLIIYFNIDRRFSAFL